MSSYHGISRCEGRTLSERSNCKYKICRSCDGNGINRVCCDLPVKSMPV